MKLLCLGLLSLTAYLCNAAPMPDATPTPDWREKYDEALLALLNERIRSGERFLERFGLQLREFEATKNEEIRTTILQEINFIMPLVADAKKQIEIESQKTGLDFIERYVVEKAMGECDILVKLFTEVQNQLKKFVGFYDAVTTPDYRDLYDRMLMELLNERIRSTERFLEHLGRQVKEFETTKNEETRASIVRELEFILPLVTEASKRLEEEVKKPGLDFVERYAVEKALMECTILIKQLGEVQKEVEKKGSEIQVFAVNQTDWRNEYDRLLFHNIQEHIMRGDVMLLFLNRQMDEFLKTKDAKIKEHIIQEVDFMVPLLNNAVTRLNTELKRTDLNHLERFLFEKAVDDVQLLLKHFAAIEAEVKKSTFFFAEFVGETTDWRNEYDKLLFEEIERGVIRGDEMLVFLQRQYNQYLQNHDKQIVELVTKEVDYMVPHIKRLVEWTTNELKRTDLNHIETYLFEKARDEANILLKHFTQLESEIKK